MDRVTDTSPPRLAYATAPTAAPSIGVLFAVEAMGSIGGNLLQVGIFFYTNRRFGWGLLENFTLAAVQGMVYVVGALLAHRVATRLAPRNALAAVYALLAAIAFSNLLTNSPAGLVAVVLAYTAVMAIGWPILESLVSTGLDAHALARRISVYNVIWAGMGAVTLAVNGAIIDYWPAGVFVITGIVHGVAAILVLAGPVQQRVVSASPDYAVASHAGPASELLHVHTLALWLSRISMPATYALIYALCALLPSLPSMQRIPTWAATMVGSAWLCARLIAFLLLGLNDWWHTRPRALLIAAWLMLAGFAGVAWQPSTMLGASRALAIDLSWLVVCQIIIGLSIGLIYAASLYFGMVLSEGSTEHSGYHEALIGLGSVLGPGAGAVAQWVRPGQLKVGVLGVVGVLAISTLMAGAASAIIGRGNSK